MNKLIFGISGVRGIVGETLTSEVMSRIGEAFSTYILQNVKCNSQTAKILIGRDARESGKMLKEAFIKGVKTKDSSQTLRTIENIEFVDMGIMTTPGVLFNIKELGAVGGVIITASHNPSEWNGIKLASEKGIFLDAEEVEKVYAIYNELQITDYKLQDCKTTKDKMGQERHISKVLETIDVKAIKDKHFKVVIDSFINEGEKFLEQLGCRVICENSKRGFEPIAENLVNLSKRVKEVDADIGFAIDPDGDRLSIVNEEGKILGEEYTLPLVANQVLSKMQNAKCKTQNLVVVTNLSTSRMIDYVVSQHNGKVIRTKVGEINVVKGMLKNQAVFGGEGNGGIINPQIQYTRDALAGISGILEYMAVSEEKISTLANRIPKYYMLKDKIKLQVANFDFLIKLFPEGKINKEDGLRIDFKEGWIHLRKSNTEPILRIICETKDEELTRALVDDVKTKLLN